MSDSLTFDNRVVVVTGAGGGIGREHALEFARRGAHVVVNDLGGSTEGDGQNHKAADQVVNEIAAANGSAIASYSSVENGAEIIERAMDSFGRVDVLINNAGISFPAPFEAMTFEQWRHMLSVHVDGSFACAHAAWPHMREQGYGRILFTASHGMYGSWAMSHYAAAKAAVCSLSASLAIEGRQHNITANTLLPMAQTRMMEQGLSAELLDKWDVKPDYVAQMAVYLTHESCRETGKMYEAGGGFVGQVRYAHSTGIEFSREEYSAEAIATKIAEISSFDPVFFPEDVIEATSRSGLDLNKVAEAFQEKTA